MKERIVNQFGDKSLYIERNEGNIYVGDYVEETVSAFRDASFELYDYSPTISPAIPRAEVSLLKDWIERDALQNKSARLALLYGKAGIGKSVVMHDLLVELQANKDYLILGLKSDQIEFVNTEELEHRIHLAQPIEAVVRNMALQYKRVILLIDQIDALSLSLSSNRAPLRSLLKLIEQIKYIQHVRIVISCRPYDLEYDPLLDRLQIEHKWELKEFTKEQVVHILLENHCEERMSDDLLRFLGNPLHLYLFLKVKFHAQLTAPLSTDLLYHQLWSKYVADDSVRKVDKFQLLSLLDALVTVMYQRQELSVHIREFETEYSAELKYLFTQGLLLLTKNGQVQFFHQTFFDYVYARRFTEKGNNLLEVLKAQHQGLFSRAAVKSILSFLREQNPTEYISIIDQLLYAKNTNGKDTYRYHLKSLALSNMAYFDTPLKDEINLISRKVFKDKVYMNVIFETVHTTNWFKATWSVIKSKGDWKNLSTTYKEKTMLMCQRSLWPDAGVVLKEVERSLDYSNEEDCRYIGNLLQSYELNCNSKTLIAFYNKLVKNRHPLEYVHLLRNILKEAPAFVCQELKENIRLQLEEKEKSGLHRVSINHEEETLYKELLKRHHDYGIQLLIDILALIYESTQYEIEGSEISNSYEFFSFRRITGGHFMSNFTEGVINIIIDDFLKNVDEEHTKRHIATLSRSKYEGFIFIVLYIYTSHPDLFKDELCDIILNRSVLSNAPCWVEYQAVEALKVTYPLWTETQKDAIIKRILAIQDRGEKTLFNKDTVQRRIKYGHPLFDIDLHKGKALEVIPIDELRQFYWTAYQERLRIDRKFNKQRLKNEKPSGLSYKSGWTSLTQEQGRKMSRKTWFHSMLKYNDDPFDWNKPSLTGQCQLFRSVVNDNPDKYIGLIDDAIACEKIPLAYSQAGMQGLVDAGRIDEAEHVLRGILGVVNNDVNSTVRGFSIHSLLFVLSDFVKGGNVTDCVFQLLCNALVNAEEPVENGHHDEKDVYNIGLNQARGNAGYMLVECAKYERYKEEIFKTIESIARKASVYTRAAILLNMATLNFLDKNRNVELFKMLMHDYDARLMSMPVHNYNPLVYFINYAVEDIMEFFRHASECPDCYVEQVIILWLAWSHNNNDERIKVLLDKMCETSEEARISLLKFLCTLENEVNEEAVRYILHFMDIEFDSPKMGKECDNIFLHIDSWSDDIQMRIAKTYVNSPLSKHQIRTFIEYLAGYAIKDPVQALTWLEKILGSHIPDDYFIWNHIVDVIIQSYNGIKSFNDSSYQDTLEHAMDLIDTIMQNSDNKYLISNFINKLDNE